MPKWTKEQSMAIEKSGSNIIVSAGAGSGKTAVLSERVLYKLTNGMHIKELLILTFTRAAAEEMKDRIRKKISKVAKLKSEIDALNSSYITTFDSFALSVVKRYHYLLNIPHSIGITDDTIVKTCKNKILDDIFLKFYESENEKFSNLIKKYSIKSDDMIRNAILELADKIEGFSDKKEFLENIKNNYFSDVNIDNIINSYEEFIKEKKKFVSFELNNLSAYFDGKYMMQVEDLVMPILNTPNIDEFSKYHKVTLPRIPKGTDEEAKEKKKVFKGYLDDLLSYSLYGGKEDIKKAILSTKDTILTIIQILEVYFTTLEEYKSKHNIYTFQDIAMLAIKILKENEEAKLELKNTFKEIMIDEYQDTNDIQEEFISLISSNNVYMVGDIKQSIYRFRGSNPIIFKDKYDNYSNNNGGYKIDLTKNFRSREEVLRDINKMFVLLMDDSLGGAEYSLSHQMIYGNTAYDEEKDKDLSYDFEIREYLNEEEDYTDDEIEIFTIAKDIKEKLKNNYQVFDKEISKLRSATYSDFVIILDRSKYFDKYKRIFEYLDVPLTILRDGELTSNTDLLIIKNIIDFIIRIQNYDFKEEFKFDYLSIGRSFLYEYSDDYLFDVITEKRYKETKLYEDFANFPNYNSLTSSQILESILDITDFYSKLNKVGEIENVNVRLEYLYSLALDTEKLGYTIEAFRDYLNEILENNYQLKYTEFNGGENSVKIITIHKSKGLEYPVCYFADLNHSFNTSDIKKTFTIDKKYGIITPLDLEDKKDSIPKILYKQEFMKEEISEKIRLFYVAITRAREKAIIILPQKDTHKLEKSDNGAIDFVHRMNMRKLSDFIYGIKDYMSEYFTSIDLKSLDLTKEYLNKKIRQKELSQGVTNTFEVVEIKIPNEELRKAHYSKSLPELIDNKTKKVMEFGTQVHEILEYTDFQNIDYNSIEDSFIKKSIKTLLSQDLFKDIKNAKIYHEYEFYYQSDGKDNHGIIDLMLEFEEYIAIIDYKLKNILDSHYLDQLQGYKNYIKTITSKCVKTYLYSIIDGELKKLD